ncbi:MAG: GNAT family N-acetyltransferase [Anaerolineales bacterium]|nr:GNAT family N-acetyltransferase [Anaerolineales bacterium]
MSDLSFHPLTRNLWNDFEELFGSHGACDGCWCMYWKLRGKAYDEAKGYEARQLHKNQLNDGIVTGLLAYLHGDVVGWVAVEPRAAYEKLAHSKILKPVDGQEVWSVPCFFVAKKFRKQGINVELLKAAVGYVRSKGGKIVEGYPVETGKPIAPPFAFTGTASAFERAGFKEVARNSPTRPIFRFVIE